MRNKRRLFAAYTRDGRVEILDSESLSRHDNIISTKRIRSSDEYTRFKKSGFLSFVRSARKHRFV